MDTISSSRKRNHSYGTFTRSRSQLFLHRNRSGQLRFDPVPTHDDTCAELVGLRRAATSCKKLKRDDGDIPRPLTKDLRARRVLKRCPRIRLFKQAGSLNYKRLLPFLLNTVENDSLNDRYPKLRKSMDQTRLQPISTSNLRLTSLSDSNGCVPMEHCAGNSGTPQQTGLHACDFNNDRSSSKSQIPECQLSRDSCKVIQLQDEKMILNGLCKLEKGPTPALSNSSVFSEVKENSPFLISCNEKSPERHDCCQSLSQLKVVEQLGVPAVGFKKGILKRNPRGCRGICTCLNCVSFRLHAERAFEFSRNQLLDAEEVAHDLMKELSILRSMLETSADSVNDNPVFDGSQVKEACRKAFAAEELAKDRFSQMNDDLNIHCRITSLQPPRVTFAVHVEEKVIPPDG
uniref:Uncharacterized protein n=1 Tax=Cajanus cajan TaxID=3821 RepID=A0A151R6Z7_CAJCA|nr:hypothetical protein KK1_040474 [Cajanus cajan]